MSAAKLAAAVALVLLALAVGWSSCGPGRVRNPARDQCGQQCVAAKNACMLLAGTSQAIASCDEAFQACAAKCQAIPAYVPAP